MLFPRTIRLWLVLVLKLIHIGTLVASVIISVLLTIVFAILASLWLVLTF